jgi:hypothetical protein
MFFLAILYALELGEIEKILVWPLGMTNISILFLKKKSALLMSRMNNTLDQ